MTNIHFRTHLLLDSANRNHESAIFGKRNRSNFVHPRKLRTENESKLQAASASEIQPLITSPESNHINLNSSYKTHVSKGLKSTVSDFVRIASSSAPHGNHGNGPRMSDLELDQVTQDCFIIPIHCVNRFMPLPLSNLSSSQTLSMMQLENPSICIVLDFMESLRPLSPSIPTFVRGPHPLTVQLGALKQTVQKVNEVGSALEGMILMNMERDSTYPFISYMVVNSSISDPNKFMTQYHSIMIEHFSPEKIQHIGDHNISVYEEVATIARPPIDMLPKKPNDTKTGYIITVFKVFPGDDREKLERSWLTWTGARMTYKYLPKILGLKRITFHKKLWPNGGITYVLLCECSSLMDYITEGCGFVEQLRARCCGYTGLYKIMDHF